ncbi:hypothetical protein ACFYPT_41580 [Streptomyces sp. NPDC005529]|uniref:hypothetical protein n=2 Tax=Streptomyces TaxID=1883 RepID=UPI0033A90310
MVVNNYWGTVYSILHNANDTYTSWAALSGVPAPRSVAITSTPNGSTQVVVSNDNNQLYRSTLPSGGTWTAFSPLATPNGHPVSQIGIAGLPDGSTQFLAITP